MIPCSIEEFEEHMDSCDGICLSCKEWTVGGVEPDARGYECILCGRNKVYGAEEALLMGRLSIEGDD